MKAKNDDSLMFISNNSGSVVPFSAMFEKKQKSSGSRGNVPTMGSGGVVNKVSSNNTSSSGEN